MPESNRLDNPPDNSRAGEVTDLGGIKIEFYDEPEAAEEPSAVDLSSLNESLELSENSEALTSQIEGQLTANPEVINQAISQVLPNASPEERERLSKFVMAKEKVKDIASDIVYSIKTTGLSGFVAGAGTRAVTKYGFHLALGKVTFGLSIVAGSVAGIAIEGVKRYRKEGLKFETSSIIEKFNEAENDVTRAHIISQLEEYLKDARLTGDLEQKNEAKQLLHRAKADFDAKIKRDEFRDYHEKDKILFILRNSRTTRNEISKKDLKELQELKKTILFEEKRFSYKEIKNNKASRRAIKIAIVKGAIIGAVGGAIGGALAHYAESFFGEGVDAVASQKAETVAATTAGSVGKTAAQYKAELAADRAASSVEKATAAVAEHTAPASSEAIPADGIIALKGGDTIWDLTKAQLEAQGIHPNNALLNELTDKVAADNGIEIAAHGGANNLDIEQAIGTKINFHSVLDYAQQHGAAPSVPEVPPAEVPPPAFMGFAGTGNNLDVANTPPAFMGFAGTGNNLDVVKTPPAFMGFAGTGNQLNVGNSAALGFGQQAESTPWTSYVKTAMGFATLVTAVAGVGFAIKKYRGESKNIEQETEANSVEGFDDSQDHQDSHVEEVGDDNSHEPIDESGLDRNNIAPELVAAGAVDTASSTEALPKREILTESGRAWRWYELSKEFKKHKVSISYEKTIESLSGKDFFEVTEVLADIAKNNAKDLEGLAYLTIGTTPGASIGYKMVYVNADQPIERFKEDLVSLLQHKRMQRDTFNKAKVVPIVDENSPADREPKSEEVVPPPQEKQPTIVVSERLKVPTSRPDGSNIRKLAPKVAKAEAPVAEEVITDELKEQQEQREAQEEQEKTEQGLELERKEIAKRIHEAYPNFPEFNYRKKDPKLLSVIEAGLALLPKEFFEQFKDGDRVEFVLMKKNIPDKPGKRIIEVSVDSKMKPKEFVFKLKAELAKRDKTKTESAVQSKPKTSKKEAVVDKKIELTSTELDKAEELIKKGDKILESGTQRELDKFEEFLDAMEDLRDRSSNGVVFELPKDKKSQTFEITNQIDPKTGSIIVRAPKRFQTKYLIATRLDDLQQDMDNYVENKLTDPEKDAFKHNLEVLEVEINSLS